MLKLFVLLMSVVSLISCSKSSDPATSSPKSDKSFSSSNSLKDLKINLNPEKLIEFKKNVSSTIQANDLALKELEISKAELQDKLNLRNIEKTKLEQNLQSDEKLKIEKLDKILILNQEIAALEAEKLAKTDSKTKEELLRTRSELEGSRKVLNELKDKKNKMSYSELVKEYLKHIQAKDSIFGDIQIAENSILALQKKVYLLLSVLAKHKVTYELDHARIKTEIKKIISSKKMLELEVESLSSKNETSKLALAQEQKEISDLESKVAAVLTKISASKAEQAKPMYLAISSMNQLLLKLESPQSISNTELSNVLSSMHYALGTDPESIKARIQTSKTYEEILADLKSLVPKNASIENFKAEYESILQDKVHAGQELVYNKDFANLFHPLTDNKVQCSSGTRLFLALSLMQEQAFDNAVVILESGHILPGFVKQVKGVNTLFGIETTLAGKAIIDYGPTKYIAGEIRVIDAKQFLLIEAMSTIGIDNVAEVYEQTQKFIANYGFITKNLKALKTEGANSSKQSLDSNLYSFGVSNVAGGDLKRDKVDRKQNNTFKVLPKKKEKPKAKKTLNYKSHSYGHNLLTPDSLFKSNNPNLFIICFWSVESQNNILCLKKLYEATDKIAKANEVLKSDFIANLCSLNKTNGSESGYYQFGHRRSLHIVTDNFCSELSFLSRNSDSRDSNRLVNEYKAEFLEFLKDTYILLVSPRNVIEEMSWPRDI